MCKSENPSLAVILMKGAWGEIAAGRVIMTMFHRLSILIFILCILSGWVSPVEAQLLSCTDSLVAFESEGPGDFRCVCASAKAAVDFLSSMGLETSKCITLRLVEHIPFSQDHIFIGAYSPISQEVTLLTYQKAVELFEMIRPIPGIDLSEELWCSYAAHELAHVISSQYLNPEIKDHTAGEYISAVTQLTVLPAGIRQKIFNKYKDVTAYQSRAEMSELYFLFDPNKFAVKCYLHFIAQENPKEFIEHLVKEGNGY
jgi:hypothetical protein